MKPQNEIVINFTKDSNDCVIVILFDAHGSELQAAAQAEFGTSRLAGSDAVKLTNPIGMFIRGLGLVRKAFVANGHTYYSYTVPQTA